MMEIKLFIHLEGHLLVNVGVYACHRGIDLDEAMSALRRRKGANLRIVDGIWYFRPHRNQIKRFRSVAKRMVEIVGRG